jgi:C-terminal processing protease CtpA/Prc
MQAPFEVRIVENKLTVADYYNPELKDTTGLEKGDFISHVNGKKMESIIDSLRPYYPASNESIRLALLANDIMRSTNQTIMIDYNSSGITKQKELTLYHKDSLNINKKNEQSGFKLLPENMFVLKDIIGYFNLGAMNTNNVNDFKKSLKFTKGTIIDLREYPSMNGHVLATYFVEEETHFVKFTRGNKNNPGEFNLFFNDPSVIPKPEETYKGKLVVLVNEWSLSHSEFCAMAFRAGINTTIIGSQTAGADGNISQIQLPGGLQTQFSGIGVYYLDGRETQRIGIVPDIEVKPTIQGIREGRDELLEKAIEIINKEP